MGYSVKNVKKFRGREGVGINCSLYRDNIRVAFYIDTANGGQGYFENWESAEERDKFMEFVKSRPEVEFHGVTLTPSPDMAMDNLLEAFDILKQAKKKTFFRMASRKYAEGHWNVMNVPYSQEQRDELVARYGDCEFYVDRVAKLVG